MVVDCMLRDAAISGNEQTFRQLFHDGEDVNAVVGQLILGAQSFDELDASRAQVSASGRLSILSFLLENHCLSLFTLNASHSSLKGMTPLGMATYLNRLDFVTVLLEKGDGLVLVDGVDGQRATPIMYAARDGHVDILHYLIRQGAQISSVDCIHRSVYFYAASSPNCLWACELNLRLQRAQSLLSHGKKRKLKLTLQHDMNEYSTLACLYRHHVTYPLSSSALHSCVKRLVTSITSSDFSAIQCLLFPPQHSEASNVPVPVLVNHPDENGWSPIHYCVTSSRPSALILDALYLAGADLSLYTGDNTMTPLHALARFGGDGSTASFRLYAFIVHLVRDLGASLCAVDLQGETCIHVAARYGRSADILMAFLECDADGAAAKIKNNDGQTAYEVAKPELRSVFEQDDGSIRPGSAASLRTIKPSCSLSSLTTSHSSGSSSSSSSGEEDDQEKHEQFPYPMRREKEDLRATLINPEEAQKVLDHLDYVAEQLRRSRTQNSDRAHSVRKGKAKEPVSVDSIEVLLQYARQNSSDLLERLRQLIDFELDDLQAARNVHASLEQLIARLEERAFSEREEVRTPTPLLPNRRFSETPSLVASGSSASLASLADLAALITPTGSPRMGVEVADLSASRVKVNRDTGKKEFQDEEEEIDFACALAAGSVTRQRRASALSGTFSLGPSDFADPTSPLEEGVNLVSIPPTYAPEVNESIVQPRESTEQPSESSKVGTKRAKRESWLDPYVRRANSDVLKAHLANLLEIEEMLFGIEDTEMEDAPSPGSVANVEEDVGWRESVDVIAVEEVEYEGGLIVGNFLDIFGQEGEHNGQDYGDQFLDMVAPLDGECDEDDGTECNSARASTVKPLHRGSVFACGRPSVLDILRIARRELYAVEEAMLTACRSIETAQHYISEAESLTNDIFEKMESTMQSLRLASALSDICSGGVTVYPPIRNRSDSMDSSDTYYGRTPMSSPNSRHTDAQVRENAESRVFPLPPPSSHPLGRQQSMQSLISLTSPSMFSIDSPSKTPADSEPVLVTREDLSTLRRLLVRKVPIWLDATSYDVDKACTWVGVVQAVVVNVRHTRM